MACGNEAVAEVAAEREGIQLLLLRRARLPLRQEEIKRLPALQPEPEQPGNAEQDRAVEPPRAEQRAALPPLDAAPVDEAVAPADHRSRRPTTPGAKPTWPAMRRSQKITPRPIACRRECLELWVSLIQWNSCSLRAR